LVDGRCDWKRIAAAVADRRFVLFLVIAGATAREAAAESQPSVSQPSGHAERSDDSRMVRVAFQQDGRRSLEVVGKVLVRAADGGILLVGRDGRLWTVLPRQLLREEPTRQPFRPLTRDELGRQLKRDLQRQFPDRPFQVRLTRHHVVCSNAGSNYTRWCAALFERLYEAFRTHWRTRALRLAEPEFPLPAIILANRQQFARFAADVGAEAGTVQGYYSIPTNRMVLCDLTGDSELTSNRATADIARQLARTPGNVATIIHEATHQIAFNCGMHTRFADNPLWLTEGMAMYFETPDLRSRSGWRTIGQPNPFRLPRFLEFAARRRGSDSLRTLIATDDRFRSPETAEDAYAEAWALTFFLIKQRRRQYVRYLACVAAKPRLVADSPEQRVKDFQRQFGSDWQRLDRDFLEFVRRLRP